MSRLTSIPPRTLADKASEEVRRDHAQAITELQRVVARAPATSRNYLGRRVFTATTLYAPAPGTRSVLLKMQGGGGGGGGASGGASFAFAGGGWSGVYAEVFVETTVGGTITIGAGGAAGAAGAAGGSGGDTFVVLGGKVYTAKGGAGGRGMANGAGADVTGISATAGGSTSGSDFNTQERGEQGIRISAGAGWSGCGGNTPVGSGGVTTTTGNGGGANIGYGGGGGGGIAAVSNQTGGIGGAGVVIIEEYA